MMAVCRQLSIHRCTSSHEKKCSLKDLLLSTIDGVAVNAVVKLKWMVGKEKEMIHIDLSKIKSSAKIEIFDRALDQLKSQAGLYGERETTEKEPGTYMYMGESMNIYVDWPSYQLWVLPKPRIDG